jgi:hypothetical protein
VSGILGTEMMPLDATLEALTDAGARHVDLLAGLEHIHLQLGADIDALAFAVGQAEFPQAAACLGIRLGEVAGHGLGHARGAALASGHLQCTVAVGLDGLYLGDAVGIDLDHRHRDGLAILGEHPRHTCLSSN